MLIELKNINKTYKTNTGVTYRALSNVNLAFEDRGLVFIVGQSGSGKSTLLNVIGGLDEYDSGELLIAGKSSRNMRASEVDAFRNTMIGFVFQEFNLIDTLSVYDNVKLSLDMRGERAEDESGKDRVLATLEQMGIADKAKNKTKNLSGGQRQRVAISRTLVKNPQLVLADEPTGALDSATGIEVIKLFKKISEDRLVIVVTHDLDLASEYGDRIVEVKDGRVYRDVRRRAEGEKIDLANVSVISDTLIRVDKGVRINDADVARLNQIVSDTGRKAFVNVETDERKVKALFPNLREAVEQPVTEPAEEEEDAAIKGKFVPYQPSGAATDPVEFKKSRFPLSKSLRLGLNNLNHKKFRLVLTVVMSIFAFVLFGLMYSFATFDLHKAMATTIQKEHMTNLAVINEDAKSAMGLGSSSVSPIKSAEIEKMRAALPNAKIIPQYRVSLRAEFAGFRPSSGQVLFSGFTEVEDVRDAGLSPLIGTGAPQNHQTVVISRYMARQLVKEEFITVNSPEEVVGHTVNIGGVDLMIGGIFESETSFYDIPENSLKFQSDYTKFVGMLYVKPGFRDFYVNSYPSFPGYVDARLSADSYTGGDRDESYSVTLLAVGSDAAKAYQAQTEFPGGSASLTGNDVYVSEGFFSRSNLGAIQTIALINADETRAFSVSLSGVPALATQNFRIRGYLPQEQTSVKETVIVSDEAYREIYKRALPVGQLNVLLTGDNEDTNQLVSYLAANGMAFDEQFVADYDMLLALFSVLKYVLLALAIIFTILVVVLLFTFISTSIRLTKKQIGILRSLGAKQSDTFMIYALEGLLVALFALAISIVLLAAVGPAVNAMMTATFGYYFTMINMTFGGYALMTALALVVAVVSVLIPLRKFTKISPIEAISTREG